MQTVIERDHAAAMKLIRTKALTNWLGFRQGASRKPLLDVLFMKDFVKEGRKPLWCTAETFVEEDHPGQP